MTATTPVFVFPYPQGTDRVMDGDNAIQALAERVEAILVARGFPTNLIVPGGVQAVTGLFDSVGGEITCGYANTGGLSIAQGNVATHANGVVLWVNGSLKLIARMAGGNDVQLTP